MRFLRRTLPFVIIAVFLASGAALAVGYNKYAVDDSSQVNSVAKAKQSSSLTEALKQASFIDKYPAVLDGIACFVKEILGQFGIAESQAP